MFYPNYHIGFGFAEKYLEFKIGILKLISHFKVTAFNVSNVLTSLHVNSGFIGGINKDLAMFLVVTEGLKVVTKEYDKAAALKEHKEAEKTLSRFRALYTKAEKINFFNHTASPQLFEQILLNFYAIEATLRNIAYSDVDIPEDQYLNEFASALSSGSF